MITIFFLLIIIFNFRYNKTKLHIFRENYTIFVPVHLENHWTGVVINQKDNKITYIDSFKKKNNNCLDTLLKYLYEKRIQMNIINPNTSFSDFKKSWVKLYLHETLREKFPFQKNSYDCGVFLILYFAYLVHEKDFDFFEQNFDKKRFAIFYNIFNQRIW